MVMTNHAAYPDTPGKDMPASASPFWITTVLRKRIGYRGIILSDDLEMGGILKFLPVDEAAVEAIRAGSDLVEICHSAELILRTYEALLGEAERSAAFRKLLLARAAESAAQARPALCRHRCRLRSRRSNSRNCAAMSLRFRDTISAAGAQPDAVAPRTTAPAETS